MQVLPGKREENIMGVTSVLKKMHTDTCIMQGFAISVVFARVETIPRGRNMEKQLAV